MVARNRWLAAGAVAMALLAFGVGASMVLAQEKEAPAGAPAAVAPDGMLRFAFGTTKSRSLEDVAPVSAGFTPVTVASSRSNWSLNLPCVSQKSSEESTRFTNSSVS